MLVDFMSKDSMVAEPCLPERNAQVPSVTPCGWELLGKGIIAV